MKYERQRHSRLFIALQERKKKIEKAATPCTLRGIVFSTRAERLRPILQCGTSSQRRQRARIKWDAQVPSIARRTLWPSDSSDKPPSVKQLLGESTHCRFVTAETHLQLSAVLLEPLRVHQCGGECNSTFRSAEDNKGKSVRKAESKWARGFKNHLNYVMLGRSFDP